MSFAQKCDLLTGTSLCTNPPPLKKNRRRGLCDSALLIVYGGHVIFPGMCGK